MKILLRIKYIGTDFCGWQYQPNARTVQDTITSAAEKLFYEKCKITGCSRTDSGVHANDFAATLEVSGSVSKIPLSRLPIAFSKLLPPDVSVCSATEVDDSFHPRYRTVCKEYIYKVRVSEVPDPFLFCRVWHYDRRVEQDAVARMNDCAKVLVGRHDFASFMATGSKIEDSVRTVHYCSVEKEGDLLVLRIAADGFLYNMVRIIVGTLMLAAAGKLDADGMERILAAKDRSKAGQTAPPEGLYLNKVIY